MSYGVTACHSMRALIASGMTVSVCQWYQYLIRVIVVFFAIRLFYIARLLPSMTLFVVVCVVSDGISPSCLWLGDKGSSKISRCLTRSPCCMIIYTVYIAVACIMYTCTCIVYTCIFTVYLMCIHCVYIQGGLVQVVGMWLGLHQCDIIMNMMTHVYMFNYVFIVDSWYSSLYARGWGTCPRTAFFHNLIKHYWLWLR